MAAIGRCAEEARRDLADAAARLRLDQLRQREPGAGILGLGVDAVVADVRDAQVVLLRRVALIDLVEFRAAVVLRAGTLIALGGVIWRGRGDESYARLRERLLQRLERGFEVVGPAIGRRVADRRVVVARALHVGNRRVVVRSKAELSVDIVGHGVFSRAGRSRLQARKFLMTPIRLGVWPTLSINGRAGLPCGKCEIRDRIE